MRWRNIRTVVGILMAMSLSAYSRADEQSKAQEAIRVVHSLDGRVFFESEWDDRHRRPKKNIVSPARESLTTTDPLPESVVAITFDIGDFLESEGALSDLIGYPVEPPVTDEKLDILASFPQLRWLSLRHTGVTSDGLRKLVAMPQLSTLVLGETGVTNDAVEHLVKLTQLQMLDVQRTKITAAGAEHLQGLRPRLAILHESDPWLTRVNKDAHEGPGLSSNWGRSADRKLIYRVSCDQATYVEGAAVAIHFDVVNTSDETIPFLSPSRPNSPSGLLFSHLRSGQDQVKFVDDRKGGSLVRLAPRASHRISFSLGKHPELPSLDAFTYSGSLHSPSPNSAYLQTGVYGLTLMYSGRQFATADANVRTRLREQLAKQGVWIGSLRVPSLSIAVLPPTEPRLPDRVASLTCEVRVDRVQYEADAAMKVTRMIRNHADEPRKIYGFSFLNDDLMFHWINRKTGKRSRQPFFSCGMNSPQEIDPAEAREEVLTYRAPVPGSYRFYISCGLPGQQDRLFSNQLDLEIVSNPLTVKQESVDRGIQ